jgi:hypothetical protein
MNVPAVILAVATVGLGSASVYLYTELDTARGRADAEAALRLDQEARIQALEEMRLGLEQQLQLAAENAGGWNMVADGSGAAAAPPPPGPATGAGEPGNRGPGRGFDGRNSFRNIMNTPEGRKALVAVQKMGLRATYKDLAKELNLSSDQASQLMDLLAKQQMEQMDGFRQNRGDPAAMTQTNNSERQRQNEIELMTLLGDKYQKYESYQDTLGERTQVENLGVQFAASSLPLADSQKKQLMTVMVEERQVSPQPQWSRDLPPQDNMAQMRKWQEDYNKRVGERLSAVLSAEQLTQYKEIQTAQSIPFGNAMAFGANARSMPFGGRRGGAGR